MLLAAVIITVKVATTAKIVGVVIPAITALITKQRAHRGLKAIVTLLLSALGAYLAVVVQQGSNTINLNVMAESLFWTWGTAIVSYYGLYKPTGIAPSLQQSTANVGIG